MRRSVVSASVLVALAVLSRAGELHAGAVDWKLTVSAGQKYDDNITYTHTNKKADFISLLGAGAALDYNDHRSSAELGIDVTQELYWKYTSNHNLSESVRGRYTYELTDFDRVMISNTLLHAEEPQNFEQEFTKGGGRYSYVTNNLDIAYVKEFTEQFSAKAGYGYDLDTTSEASISDSYVNRFSVEGNYAFNARNVGLMRYDFHRRTLDRSADATINSVKGGLRHYFNERLSLEGSGGVDFLQSYDGKEYDNPQWAVTLSNQITEKTLVNLFSFTQMYTTNPYTEDVFDSWRISSGLSSQLSRKLTGSASVFYGRGEYIGLGIKDKLFGGNAVFAYDIRKNLTGRLSYSYSQALSNIGSREFGKNVVFLGITADF